MEGVYNNMMKCNNNMIKMVRIKEIVVMLLIAAFLLPLSYSAYAVTEKEISTDFVEQYALHFMRESQEKNTIQVDELFPLYGVNNEITGYYVSFSDRGKESGYMVISLLTTGSPVVEFSFEGQGRLMEVLNERNIQSNKCDGILYAGPDSFYLSEQNGYYSVNDRNMVSKNKISLEYEKYMADVGRKAEMRSTHPIEDGIINWADSNVRPDSVKKISNFGAGTDYWLMDELQQNAGNCYPTAGTNILWYWGKKRGRTSIKNAVSCSDYNETTAGKIYNRLYSTMHSNNNSTFDFMIIAGFRGFFDTPAQTGGVWNYKKLNKNSPYSSYVAALQNQCPIFLVLKEGTSIFSTGHGVFAFGYANGYNNEKYLFVMDGWYNYGRFVKFDYYPKIFGFKIWVR